MHWATVDPFILDDPFWQQKMGMPAANKQFLEALLQYGECSSYHFFVGDSATAERFSRFLKANHPDVANRVFVKPQALLSGALREQKLDVFHNGDFTSAMPYLMEWRNRLDGSMRFPVTGVTHSLDTVTLYGKFISLLLAKPKPYDAIVCTSRCAVEMLQRAFQEIRASFQEHFGAVLPEPPRLVRIPLGIPERSRPLPPRQAARERLGVPQASVVLLSLGRFSPRSKMDLSPFLEGFSWLRYALLQECAPEVFLVLAGAGRKDNVRLVAEMVSALGLQDAVQIKANVSEQDKDALYASADIFCSLVDNYQETFGLTLLEAMDAGLPVVASDFNGYRDLVLHGETGFLVPTYAGACQDPWDSLAGLLDLAVLRFYRAQKIAFDMKAMVQALHTLVCRADVRREFSRKARRQVQEFRWSRVIRAYRALWQELGALARQGAHKATTGPYRPILTPSVGKIFPHYPSEVMTDETLLGLGPSGGAFAAKVYFPVQYAEVKLLLKEDILHAMAQHVSRQEMTVGELVLWAKTLWGMDRDSAMLHLDWLFKHAVVAPKKMLMPAFGRADK
uniref:Glycosyltransferase n=1 Tax=Desulfacinum infernum TaxID=35837 RepID=A0A832EKW7_9BACT